MIIMSLDLDAVEHGRVHLLRVELCLINRDVEWSLVLLTRGIHSDNDLLLLLLHLSQRRSPTLIPAVANLVCTGDLDLSVVLPLGKLLQGQGVGTQELSLLFEAFLLIQENLLEAAGRAQLQRF